MTDTPTDLSTPPDLSTAPEVSTAPDVPYLRALPPRGRSMPSPYGEVERAPVPVPSLTPGFDASSRSEPGSRSRNDDAAATSTHLLAVADGVSSVPGSGDAARLAVRTSARLGHLDVQDTSDLEAIAHRADYEISHAGPEPHGGACTLDLVAIVRRSPDTATLCGLHLGDGATWVLGPHGAVRFRTARHRNKSGQLLYALGDSGDLRYDTWSLTCEPHDRVVVATDGLWADLGLGAVEALLCGLRPLAPRHAADLLVEAALRLGASDNVTVVVADVRLA